MLDCLTYVLAEGSKKMVALWKTENFEQLSYHGMVTNCTVMGARLLLKAPPSLQF